MNMLATYYVWYYDTATATSRRGSTALHTDRWLTGHMHHRIFDGLP